MDFSEKVVLVTGGSRGIGAATVKAIVSSGGSVVVHYGSNQDAAEKLRSDLGHDNCPEALSKGLHAGMVGVNTFMIAHAEAPFGGLDHSGMGREGGTQAIYDYLNTKLTHFAWG